MACLEIVLDDGVTVFRNSNYMAIDVDEIGFQKMRGLSNMKPALQESKQVSKSINKAPFKES